MPAARAAYFDTSVLLKRYVREDGSDRALSLIRKYSIVSAAIAPLEIRSALRRVHAEGVIPAKAFRSILRRIDSERSQWDLVVLSVEILHSAERIVEDLNVRSLDAIHLACAAACQTRLRRRLSFVTSDVSQQSAAHQLGFEIVSV
jgi:predicted nucleic acid-binding protein